MEVKTQQAPWKLRAGGLLPAQGLECPSYLCSGWHIAHPLTSRFLSSLLKHPRAQWGGLAGAYRWVSRAGWAGLQVCLGSGQLKGVPEVCERALLK